MKKQDVANRKQIKVFVIPSQRRRHAMKMILAVNNVKTLRDSLLLKNR